MKDKDERSELRGLLPRGKKARHNTDIPDSYRGSYGEYFSAQACGKSHKRAARIALKDPVINRKIII